MQKPGELKKPLQPGALRKDLPQFRCFACILCGSNVVGKHQPSCPLSVKK